MNYWSKVAKAVAELARAVREVREVVEDGHAPTGDERVVLRDAASVLAGVRGSTVRARRRDLGAAGRAAIAAGLALDDVARTAATLNEIERGDGR